MTKQTTFEETDAFGWSAFAKKLEAFLITERGFVDGSLVVSLNAPFGRGKTTFIHMWKNHLDARQESDPAAPLCILLNAWEDDYCGDPLLSLVDAIEKELQSREPDKEIEQGMAALKEATKDVAWFMVGMANSAVSHWTGLDSSKAGDYSESKKAKRGEAPARPDILSLFQARKEALGRLKDALRSLFSKNDRPVLLLVDELDRCRPDFAVQYLETIKHIFDVDGLAFVLAVDLKQLENSARALFGNGLDFPEYFRKFAHRNIQLPLPDETGIRNLVTKYTAKYLDDPATESPRRKSLLNFENTRRALVDLSFELRLTPRQIEEAFRIIGHLTSVREKTTGDLHYHIANATIFLTFLSIVKPDEFQEIRRGELRLDRLIEIVTHLPITKHREWWAFVLRMSLRCDSEKLEIKDILAAFVRHQLVRKETTVEEFQKELQGYSPGGFAGFSSLSELARKIQEVESFAT